MTHELLILPEHLISPPGFSGVRVTRSLVLYICFVDRCLSFCTFSFGLYVVYSDSDCPFGIFKLFLEKHEGKIKNGQSGDRENTEHKTNTEDKLNKNTIEKSTKMSNTDSTKIKRGGHKCS